jgi:hypothetical protein
MILELGVGGKMMTRMKEVLNNVLNNEGERVDDRIHEAIDIITGDAQ